MAVLLVTLANLLAAQKVLYSSYLNDRNTDRFEIIGKAGDYYWIQKNKKKNQVDLPAMPWRSDKQPAFEIYDTRLNDIRTVLSAEITDTTMKQYFISSEKYFDQLILLSGHNKTFLTLQRYAPDGEKVWTDKIIDTLPFAESGIVFCYCDRKTRAKYCCFVFKLCPMHRSCFMVFCLTRTGKPFLRINIITHTLHSPLYSTSFLITRLNISVPVL